MIRRSLMLGLAAAVVAAPVAQAATLDHRIRVIRYVPDQVTRLDCTLGYVVTLYLGADERIENVAIGDSLGWQITPNRRARVLFIKPNERATTTNMSVVTNLRSYDFDLRAFRPSRARGEAVLFTVRFDYPEPAVAAVTPPPPPPPPEAPKDVNHAYSFSGSNKGLPTRVFDDGHSTYFVFAEGADFPAIFAVDPDNKEAVVNIAQRDGYVVVDRLAAAFVLRRGELTTRIINDGYREDAGQPSELSPHKKR
ncbi:TrbG/VirB9 family P-type conjugative transfer protein [uncultured Caulobacter sp.]|uniref:TrbG/VirB9 family P-type conjugative transfer protein n=1 Tax=uncultured Caulobacter sp. TaxID=158749 RepID=UPI0026281319|nr:TrbG/VirB9 family P-type conjugative transfer protein [uncultured Caulobacter sp.]